MEDSEESLLKAIHHYQSGLERYLQRQDETKMLHNLGRLKKLPIKVSHLEQTGVGRTVNSLRKLDGKVGDAAKSLVGKWKEMVMQEEDKKTEVSSADESPDEVPQDIDENENASPKNTQNNRRDHDEHRKKSKDEKHDSSKSKSNLKENRHQKKHKKRSHSSSDEDLDTSKNYDSDSNADNQKRLKVEKPHDKYSVECSKDKNKESGDSKKLKHVTNDNGIEHESRKSKSDKNKKHESNDEKKHKHKSHQDKKDTSHSTNKTSKHEKNPDSSKHEKEKDQKKKEHRDKDKNRHEKRKSKDKSEDKREKSSKSHNTSSSSKKDKNLETVKSSTSVVKNGIGSGSGTSFADALGMCEPTVAKKKKASSQAEKPREPSPMSDDNDIPLEMPLPKEPLENLDINISTLLPPITPHYRPLGLPIEDQPRRIMTDDEALSRVMMNKNHRTKVYSGNKVSWGKVPSLFDICVRILQDNLDALEYTGGVPYSILKPILEKATANQLYMMEHHNPYLIEDSDELWKLHCQKDFRNKTRDELETWRDMYMRCLDEREAKLRALTANIKQSQDKSLPVRTTKLAYVDSVAKPPRNIARKQAKNDTGNVRPSPSSKLAALATKGEASKVAVPNPGARAAERSSSSNHAMKAKKAPLMAKTLSLFKNRFRR